MKESVIYQEIEAIGEAKGLEQGLKEGLEQGLEQGKQQEAVNLILKQLQRRVGELPQEIISQIDNLSLEELENLAEVLLDFKTQTDLTNWLTENR